MKVIFVQDVKGRGRRGDVKNVASGYARNYLIPNKFALEANALNKKHIDGILASFDKAADKAQKEVSELADFINHHPIVLRRKSADGEKLFGSVTARDIAAALSEKGADISHRQIEVENAIKTPGHHTVKVRLGNGVDTTLTVTVEAGE